MVTFTRIAAVMDDRDLLLQGISDLETVMIDGQPYVFVASEADGTITSFRLREDQTPELVDTVLFGPDTGTFSISQVNISSVGGEIVLLPSGRLDDEVATYRIDATGHFSAPILQTPDGVTIRNFKQTETIVIDGKTFLFVSENGQSGISSFRMKPDDTFNTKRIYDTGSFDFLGDVSAFTSVTVRDKTFLITASAFDAGVNTFRVGQHGNLHLKDSIAPSEASGFSLPQALEAVTVAGNSFVLLASAGSNSITAYSVNRRGELTETDHVIDGVNTRFQDASVLESFTFNLRTFVLAAGSDDGITLFELTPSGTFAFIDILADDFDTTLNNVTDIEVITIGDMPHLLVSSGSENGFTQIELNLEEIGASIVGKRAHETLTGTDLDDLISGMGGSDTLFGGTGDDRIIDGDGRDRLFGGEGADIFQFVDDNKRDFIKDYEVGIDLIDFSLLSNVSHIASLRIVERSFGAVIFAGDEVIRVETIDGNSIDPKSFSADDFIF